MYMSYTRVLELKHIVELSLLCTIYYYKISHKVIALWYVGLCLSIKLFFLFNLGLVLHKISKVFYGIQ